MGAGSKKNSDVKKNNTTILAAARDDRRQRLVDERERLVDEIFERRQEQADFAALDAEIRQYGNVRVPAADMYSERWLIVLAWAKATPTLAYLIDERGLFVAKHYKCKATG